MRESRLPTPADVIRWLTAFALTIVGGVTLIGNRIHAAGNDAVFTQSLVEPRRAFRRDLLPERHHAQGPAGGRRARPRVCGSAGTTGIGTSMSVHRRDQRGVDRLAAAAYGADHRREPSCRARGRGGRVRALHALRLRVRGPALQPEHPRDVVRGRVATSCSTTAVGRAPPRRAARPSRSRSARCSGSGCRRSCRRSSTRRRSSSRRSCCVSHASTNRRDAHRLRPRIVTRRGRRVRRARRCGTCCAAASASSGRAGGRTRATRARASASASASSSRVAGTPRTATTSTGRCCS